ncbi:MAG: YkgJ family cysteine cluster protein [Candidatus Melainabacteria bacterium]|nr:YkgJ family cysteine cluster protein [Candidatus Melainabacteria bacterium]
MTAAQSVETLHIPEGLNYECTGCGKCCGGWSVPLTEQDYFRIADIDWGKQSPERYFGKSLFREMRDYESESTPYTHAIMEGADGHCPFLVDKLCFIHAKFDSKTKPSICQLFPYSFNRTPSGTYATISFYSMGAVNNSGRALVEQRDYLESKFAEFNQLYPDHQPNWSQIQLTTGISMTWDQYLTHEEKLISYIKDRSVSLENRFLNGSNYLARIMQEARGSAVAPAVASTDGAANLNWLDKNLLTALHKIYFPIDKLGRGEGDFNFYRFLYQTGFQGLFPGTKIRVPGKSYSFETLERMPFPSTDPDIEDLIYRYFYSRIFGKHYFGAGFGQLSLITGFNHLAIIFGLIKLQSKAIAKLRNAEVVSYLDVAAAVRQLEKRLGETSLDGMAAATFEALMTSNRRVARVLAHS